MIELQSFQELLKDLMGIYVYFLLERDSPKLEDHYREYLRLCPADSELKKIIITVYNSLSHEELSQEAVHLISNQPVFCHLFFRRKGIKSLLMVSEDALNGF